MTTETETRIVTIMGELKEDVREMKGDAKLMLHHPPCAELQVLQGKIHVLWVALCALGAALGWLVSSLSVGS